MKKCIILYHGFCTDPTDFGALPSELNKIYDHVEMCTFPGHGDNDVIENFTVDKVFDMLVSTFDRLNEKYDSIDVVGFSMGGALSAYLSSIRTFNNLILLAPANEYINPKLPIDFAKFYINKFKDYISMGTQEEKKQFAIENLHVINNEKKSLEIARNKLLPKYTVKNISTFASIIKRANEHLFEVPNPTLIIWGQLDQLVPHSVLDFYSERMTDKRSKIVEFDDISHLMLQSENDEEVIKEILKFLKKDYKHKGYEKERFGKYRLS